MEAFPEFDFEELGEFVTSMTASESRSMIKSSLTPIRTQREEMEQGDIFAEETGINLDEIMQHAPTDGPNDFNFEYDGEIQPVEIAFNKPIVITPSRRKRIQIVDDETQIPFEIMREGIKNSSDLVVKRPFYCIQKSVNFSDLQYCIFSTSDLSEPLLKKIKRDSEEKDRSIHVERARVREQEDQITEMPDYEIGGYEPDLPKPSTPDHLLEPMQTPKKSPSKLKFFDSCKNALLESENTTFHELCDNSKNRLKIARQFYQLLVLINSEKVAVVQTESYSDMIISKGVKFGV